MKNIAIFYVENYRQAVVINKLSRLGKNSYTQYPILKNKEMCGLSIKYAHEKTELSTNYPHYVDNFM